MDLIRGLGSAINAYRESRSTPEPEPDAAVAKLRAEGRGEDELANRVRAEVHANGKAWPTVIEDEKTGTTTVPATFEGILAFLCSWDSKLLDEELMTIRKLTQVMVPMGLNYQPRVRAHRKAMEKHWEEVKAHDPETWERIQGARV